ncbi:Uncharacterised protein [Mycobacteroides abscessus subsp. massiliense]|nr:Uncharacterised protein [Mycobacteroides abscessus subsp. abscessus]SKT81536.1 Uncharacterised protein [Mycobacteroides abscessus subsp. massiliense]SKT98659.1 Uncharacterised protein [Mycobacteroides abscessus subsp. massiliense]
MPRAGQIEVSEAHRQGASGRTGNPVHSPGISWSFRPAARSIPDMTASKPLGKCFTLKTSPRASAAEAVGWAGIESVPVDSEPFVDETEVVPRIRVGHPALDVLSSAADSA